MLFSIVIPTHQNRAELARCLDALSGLKLSDPRAGYEVLVCVDGSTDGTLEMLQQRQDPFLLRVFTHAQNAHRGRSATRNLAMSQAQGVYTLFLDSDMIVPADLLEQHLTVLESGPCVSIGGVEYVNVNENVWARYTSERGVGKFAHGDSVPSQYFITPDTALPTAWWTSVGGFDEVINRYGGEDMELGYRIHLRHKPAFIFNRKASVRTLQDKTLDQALAQLQEYGATGLRYISRKHPALKKIYWVEKCDSRSFKDQLFGFLTIRPFREVVRFLVRLLPYFMQRPLINYLVVAHVHQGYRNALTSEAP